MKSRIAAWLAWSLGVAIALLAAAAILLLVPSGFRQEAFAFPGFVALLGLTFAGVGAILASKRPRNAIGWIFLASGFAAAVQELAFAYATLAFQRPHLDLPAVAYAAWLEWLWIPYSGTMLVFLPLLFPNGRLPGVRGRWISAAAVLGMCMALAGEYLAQGPLPTWPDVANPLGLLPSEAADSLAAAGFSTFGLSGMLAIGSLARRVRVATVVERQQYKWLLASGSLAGIAFTLAAVGRALAGTFEEVPGGSVLEVLLSVGLGAIPVGVGIAITRYHLYDIDRVISRTVSYTLVIALLVLVYVLAVLFLRNVLPVQGDLAIAASTLIVAALFDPLRRGVRARIDRRFNRSHYVAQRELERFADQLRNRVDLSGVTSDLLAAVSRTVQPTSAAVWLRWDRPQ